MHYTHLIQRAPQDEGKGSGQAEKHPIAELQRQMNQAFEAFWGQGDRSTSGGGWPFGGHTPRTDVVETDDSVEITVELPGMEQSDVEVSLAGDALTVSGVKKVESKEDKKGYYLSERSYGAFSRSIPLPPGVDSDKADATFRNGLLKVRLPRSSEAKSKSRKIEIK
ncbi:Hsp20/alpha crystallin family protein [Roseovarius sp.]|uniref:Hsp20/alpha crystallin family protein n=1 Tax=Roseovarius sp. TaxID=1486281 RepID=UPI0035641E17